MGLAARVCLVGEGGLWGPSPPCCSGMSWLTAPTMLNGQCPKNPQGACLGLGVSLHLLGTHRRSWKKRKQSGGGWWDGLQISLSVAGIKDLTGGLGRSAVTEPAQWGSGNAGAAFPLSVVSVQPPR